MSESLKDIMMSAPDSHISEFLVSHIRDTWDNDPTPLQLLHTMDLAVRGSEVSGMVLNSMDTVLKQKLLTEGKSYEELVSQATWRNK